VGGHPSGYTMLTPYGTETKDKLRYVLLLMHRIFNTAIAEYGKGRTFTESYGQSCVSEGKGAREERGHQTN
jgi:hypothetical protein